MSDPNTFTPEEIEAAKKANPQPDGQGTETEPTDKKPEGEAEPPIDYQTKFSESSKEALRLLEENKAKDAEIERLRLLAEKGTEETPTIDDLYPGFNELDPEAQANLNAFAQTVSKRTKDEIYKDPAISFARATYNESKFDKALTEVVKKYPDLANSKEEFKTKYFNANNTPDNIESILLDVAKIYLFDKARDIGAKEEKERNDRVDMERTTGGDKTPTSSRTLEDWHRMAQENPAKFAKMSKEYNADVASGKLKQ